jgi:hypothetical protein
MYKNTARRGRRSKAKEARKEKEAVNGGWETANSGAVLRARGSKANGAVVLVHTPCRGGPPLFFHRASRTGSARHHLPGERAEVVALRPTAIGSGDPCRAAASWVVWPFPS